MIKLDAKRFSPGQVGEVTGAINGLKLNRELNLKLFPPHDLEPGLRLVGFGRVADKRSDGSDVVVLIQNSGWKEVSGSKRVWKIESEFFTGKVEISSGILAAGETKVKYGKIIDPRQNEAYRVRLKAPNDWDVNIKILCTQFNEETIETMFLNKGSESSEGKVGRWTIYNDYFSTDFIDSGFSQILAPGDIINRSIDPQGAARVPNEARWTVKNSDRDFETCVPRSEDLSRALAQEVRCDLPILIHPRHASDTSRETEKHWTIDNPMFTVTVSSRLESCLPDGNRRVVKGMTTLTLKDWVEIREPSNSSDSTADFDLLGYNILNDGRVSLVLRNRSKINSAYVGGKGQDWSYSLIAYRPSVISPPCDPPPRGSTRNCLIYSFLVMDPVQFIDHPTNVVLKAICQRFAMETKCDPDDVFDPRLGGIKIPVRQ
jgi:hypothetical protein